MEIECHGYNVRWRARSAVRADREQAGDCLTRVGTGSTPRETGLIAIVVKSDDLSLARSIFF